MIEHTTRAFDLDLHQLARKIAEMGRLDGEQIADAIDALAKRDTALAKRVIAADDQVDALQREIEEKAATTIARRQPMAVDLREILGALPFPTILSGLATLPKIRQAMMLVTEELRLNEMVLHSGIWWMLCATMARVLQSYERKDVAVALDVLRRTRSGRSIPGCSGNCLPL